MEDWDADLSPCNFATTHFLQKEAVFYLPVIRCCPSTVSRTVWKRKCVNFQRIFLVSPMEKERRHAFVRVQIEYGFGCFQVRFGLVVSTVWIGSEYGFVTLLDESASESHTQNSTRTAPYVTSRPPIWQLAFWSLISLELRDPWNGGPSRNAPQQQALHYSNSFHQECYVVKFPVIIAEENSSSNAKWR